MRCQKCGFEDPDEYVYCSNCGEPRASSPPVSPGPGPGAAVAVPPVAPSPRPAREPRPIGPSPEAPPRQRRRARLVGLEGPVQGQQFALDQAELVIGRLSNCALRVADQSVSRLHARIRMAPAGYLIEDIKSANGTWVNGIRLSEPQALVEGDEIRIGNATFTFEHEAEPEATPPGAMTVVSNIADEPGPFRPAAPVGPPRAQAQAPLPVPPRPTPAAPVAQPRPPPTPSPRAGATVDPLDELRDELANLKRDLAPFIERLNALATSSSALEGQLSRGALGQASRSPQALRELAAELEADGGLDEFLELQRLLLDVRSEPTNEKLLRLAEQLPTITRLLQVYLRALSLVRDLGRE